MTGRKAKAAEKTANREIVFTRVFDAPRDLVFKAWTDPKHLVHWWGPRGFTNTFHEIDVRPGGVWRFIMHGPDGVDYPNRIVYDEVVNPERLVYSHGGGKDGDSADFQATVTFVEQGDQTRLTMRLLFPSAAERDRVVKEYGAIEGGNQTLDRLAEQLAKMAAEGALVVTRVFDAPRELVFRAWTDPKHLAQWWAPQGFTTPFCKVDFRPGGVFHYCMRSPDGKDYWGIGVYREIVEPERIVYTDAFADAQGNPVPPAHYGMSSGHPAETLVTVTFAEHDGKTKLTLRQSIPASFKEHDMAQQGWTEMLDKLAGYVGGEAPASAALKP